MSGLFETLGRSVPIMNNFHKYVVGTLAFLCLHWVQGSPCAVDARSHQQAALETHSASTLEAIVDPSAPSRTVFDAGEQWKPEKSDATEESEGGQQKNSRELLAAPWADPSTGLPHPCPASPLRRSPQRTVILRI
jgi:hypothetical protein